MSIIGLEKVNVRSDFDDTSASDPAGTRRMRNAPPQSACGDASTSTSLVGMIMGIVGIFFAPCFAFSIAALVLGYKGRKCEPTARGFWVTALTTGWIGLVVGVVFVAVVVLMVVVTLNDPSSSLNRR